MRSADLSRDEHLAAVCGTGTGPAAWRQSQERHALLVEQSKRLAGALHELAAHDRPHVAHLADRAGKPDLAYAIRVDGLAWYEISARVRQIEMPEDAEEARAVRRLKRAVSAAPWTEVPAEPVEMVGLITRERSEITQTRRLRELPTVAGRDRRPLLGGFRHWLETGCPSDYKGRTYCRYFVVTNGPRVGWDEDPQRATRRFSRKISKLAAWAKARGVDFAFRAVEVTLNDDGGHIHANVAAVPRAAMGRKEWGKFLASMESEFGARIEDNGRVQDARELVKYFAKPAEVQKEILDHPDRDRRLRWLHAMHFRTRIAQPLGDFREHWRSIQDAKLKPCAINEQMQLVPKSKPAPKGRYTPEDPENQIVGHVLSNRAFTPWAEPSVLVRRYTPDPTTPAGRVRLMQINDIARAAREAWDANGAPAPEIALRVAHAWREAGDDSQAGQVWALAQPQTLCPGAERSAAAAAPRGEAASGLDTRQLTVPEPEAAEPRPPPPWPPPLPSVVEIDDERRVIDPETGEILGLAAKLLPDLDPRAVAA